MRRNTYLEAVAEDVLVFAFLTPRVLPVELVSRFRFNSEDEVLPTRDLEVVAPLRRASTARVRAKEDAVGRLLTEEEEEERTDRDVVVDKADDVEVREVVDGLRNRDVPLVAMDVVGFVCEPNRWNHFFCWSFLHDPLERICPYSLYFSCISTILNNSKIQRRL